MKNCGFNATRLAEALHNATAECVEASGWADREDVERRATYGRGVCTGAVAGLIACGWHFDDAWRTCLELAPILPECIPQGWPTLKDYQEAQP